MMGFCTNSVNSTTDWKMRTSYKAEKVNHFQANMVPNVFAITGTWNQKVQDFLSVKRMSCVDLHYRCDLTEVEQCKDVFL